jgi:hypothetical protein
MANFKATLKKDFIHKGVKFEKGMQVDFVSKQSSIPNLFSAAGKQDVIDAFQRKYGILFDQVHITNDYLNVEKY